MNTSTSGTRKLIVRAGEFGMDQFTDVKVRTSEGSATSLDLPCPHLCIHEIGEVGSADTDLIQTFLLSDYPM